MILFWQKAVQQKSPRPVRRLSEACRLTSPNPESFAILLLNTRQSTFFGRYKAFALFSALRLTELHSSCFASRTPARRIRSVRFHRYSGQPFRRPVQRGQSPPAGAETSPLCLVEEIALEKAEQECVQDAGERAAARARAAVQRGEQDRKLVAQMIKLIAELFPSCPATEVASIAEHTAIRGSGRVGHSEAGRNLDEKALTLAVGAAVRHNHTP